MQWTMTKSLTVSANYTFVLPLALSLHIKPVCFPGS